MTISKRLAIVLLIGVIEAVGFEIGGRHAGVQSLVSAAQAVVGRPLTPVSVAGVARRTARRCAVGVYNC